MSPEKNKSLKLLKVDNWSVFFLQRLQLMFAKGDCCDLTLKFSNSKELKVHRLVLNTCTKYFESVTEVNNTIKMPEPLTYTSMLPIINFMYSGKLEFKPEIQESLLTAARMLNMTILVQLLIAQKPTDAKLKMVSKEELMKLPTGKLGLVTPLSQEKSQWNSSSSMLAEKKLPFWRKRVYPLKMPEKSVPEDPGPTRFELPSEETSSLLLNVPSFNEISYESEPVVPSPNKFTPNNEKLDIPIKRRVVPPLGVSKMPKLQESQIISGNWSDEDDDGHFESIHTFEDSDDDQQICEKVIASTPKPILKPPIELPQETAPSSSKKVRFCLEDKENAQTTPVATPIKSESPEAVPPENISPNISTSVAPQIISPPVTKQEVSQVIVPELPLKPENKVKIYDPKEVKPKDETLPNHAKIIAEVLKKYPDLVKNNKNIKLKITTPNNILVDGKPFSGPPKSQYVVVKPNSIKVDTVQTCSDAENTTGPWICKRCTIDSKHLVFESYYLFRKHLMNVHNEKIDSKICEICGHKSSKKNLHLFHLFTKHGIKPPKHIRFPKCTFCKYIALNDALLAKHYSTHQQNTSKELLCNICKLSFKSVNSFQAHCVTCKPNSEIRTFPCKNCNKVFRTCVSMKAHFKDCQGPVEQQTDKVQPVEMIQVPLMDQKSDHLVQLPPALIMSDNNMALLHSDGNSLSNVAQGVSNIGFTVLPEDHRTVILLDENADFFLQGNNSVVVTGENNDEYVVPELLQDNMAQLYSTSNLSYTTVNGTSVITYPVVHMQQDGSLSHPNEAMSIPVSQNNELFVSNKEITITEDMDELKTSQSVSNETVQITPENEISQQDSVPPTTCIVRLDNTMIQNNQVCLVNSDTPISIMDSDGTLTDTATLGSSQTVNVISNNESVSIINSDNILKSKPVISVGPDKPARLSMEVAKVKVEQISTEWDFDAEEEDSEIVDDPDSRPSRPSIELQEIV